MADITDKLRLKEQAEEDTYFARLDRERIKALRDKRLAESPDDAREQPQPTPGESKRKPSESIRSGS